jgi:DNA-binding CsgD family transcriptional regulator
MSFFMSEQMMDSFAGQLPQHNPRPIRWPKDQRTTHAAEVERGKRFGLKPADILILKALSYGLDQLEVSEITGLNFYAVKASTARMRRELKAKNNAHAIAIALRLKLIT